MDHLDGVLLVEFVLSGLNIAACFKVLFETSGALTDCGAWLPKNHILKSAYRWVTNEWKKQHNVS